MVPALKSYWAVEVCSFLQRRLHIGYPRAVRIMEQLEEEMARDEEEEEA